MTWAKLSDDFWCHPSIVGLSDRAFRLHVTAICWSAALETDGQVPRSVLPILRGSAAAVRELVEAGLWEPDADGWRIPTFLAYNPSREELEERRSRRAEAGKRGAERRWQQPPPGPRGGRMTGATGDAIAADAAPSMANGMPNAMANAMASAMANAIPDAIAEPMASAMADATTACMHPTRPDLIPEPICDDSSLRSSSSQIARGARDDDTSSLEGATDPDPPAVREVRDLVLMALPRKFQADPLTFDEAAQLGRDYAGQHAAVAEAIAECRRRNQLPFPSRVRRLLQEASDASARDRAWADDPILDEWRALGVVAD